MTICLMTVRLMSFLLRRLPNAGLLTMSVCLMSACLTGGLPTLSVSPFLTGSVSERGKHALGVGCVR